MASIMSQDIDSDLNRLYEALRDNKLNTAKVLHCHLKTHHQLDNKSIRDSLTSLGLEKTVEVAQKAISQR